MSALEVLGVDNVMFSVGELEAALEFYGQRLGLPLKFQVTNVGIAAFRLGTEEPGLLVSARDMPERGPAIRRGYGWRSRMRDRPRLTYGRAACSPSPSRSRSLRAGPSNSPIPGETSSG